MKKKVSILMTCFNAEKSIRKSINSSLNQKFKNYELIIVDDGSNDNSKKIINSFKNNKIRKFFLTKHIGRTKALNFGLNKCRGKYIAILDADDISSRDRISTQYFFLEKNKNIDLVASFFKKKTLYKKKIEYMNYRNIAYLYKCLNFTNLIAHSTVMYRKKVINEYKIYNEKYEYAQDYEMILKILKKKKIDYIPKYLTTIYIDKNNMSN
jgi:glycosyltransferase involved in cell wall biosynthesis